MKSKKNKVYFVQGDEDIGGAYIAAKTSKDAKNIALGIWVAETVENPFIDLKIRRCWSVKETDYDGLLDIYKINDLKLTWWECSNCCKDNFEIINEITYKCKDCNNEDEIPYY